MPEEHAEEAAGRGGGWVGFLVLYAGEKVLPPMKLDLSPEATREAADILARALEPLVNAARKVR